MHLYFKIAAPEKNKNKKKERKILRWLEIFRGARRSAIYTKLYNFALRIFITELLRLLAKSIQNYENGNFRHTGQGEAQHRKYYLAVINLMAVWETKLLSFVIYKVKQSRNRPDVAQTVPGGLGCQIFMTFGTWRWWGRQPHAPAAFTSRNVPGAHFH